MKKLILLLITTLLITSCDAEEKKEIEVKNNETIKSFETPVNDLEKEINKDEANLKDEYNSKLKLVQSYLKYWDAYYKENIFADKALNILNWMKEDSKVNYFKGYAYEIQTKYTEALIQYNKVIAYDNLDVKEKVNVINQIGHIYDLQWDMEKANEYYIKAEKIDPEDIKTLLNRWRYEFRKFNIDSSEKYFNFILNKTENKKLKSEIYYNLSTIYLQRRDIDKAIEYSKKWIEIFSDYPNNHLALWVSYITKWWDDIDKSIGYLNKSIDLYENNSVAYKHLGIYYYIKDDFDKAIKYFKKQVEISKKDILLMSDDKIFSQYSWNYDLARSYAQKWDVDNTIKHLNLTFKWDGNKLFLWFILEYNSSKSNPFEKLKGNEKFESEIKDFILKYKE